MTWSRKLIVNKSDYTLEGVFSINSNYYNAIEDLISKKNSMGVVYGELGIQEKFDVSLTNVSHHITDMKLSKVSNTLSVKCKVLETYKGKELKNIIDGGIDDGLRMCIRGTKSNNTNIISRIFTIDIDLPSPIPEDKLRKERKEKLDDINKKILNS